LIEIVVWWVLLTACDLMLISSVDRYELLVGVAFGLACALIATFARSAQPSSWSLRLDWLAWLPLIPLRVIADTWHVLVAAAKGDTGSWRETPVADAVGDTARARGARAIGAMALNLAPGSVVLDVDATTGLARLHSLGTSGGSRLEQTVAR
jgi:multisubunit Na+/H+ antiporter MnhE subunit